MEVSLLPNSCHSVKADGQPCGCFAVRHSQFCRHHQPPARKTRPAHPASDPSPTPGRPMTQAELTAAWRTYHHQIRSTTDLDSLQEDTETILTALGARRISHRSAGRLLQAIEDRRSQLLESQIKAQLVLMQYVEAIQKARESGTEGLC